MDPEMIMESIAQELQEAVQKMGKAKSLEEKKQYSEIVANLSNAFTGFLRIAGGMMDMDEFDDFDDDDVQF